MQHETKQKLNAMILATGHVLSLDDFDDIADLDRLQDQVCDPASGIDSPLTAHVVYCRGTPVYPLTLSHLQYIEELPAIVDVDPDTSGMLALWVSTLEYITDGHYDPTWAAKAFKLWARRSRWTESDMQSVFALRFPKMREGDDGKDDSGALVSLLSREYDGTPAYWMREAPIELIQTVWADWQRCQNAQAAQYQKNTKGKAVAPAPTPKFVAVRKFRDCAERIEAKWRSKS